mgnify:FL=1|jgi:hypothetical protein
MKKIMMLFVLALACVGVQAQTVVNKTNRIKNTQITWSVAGKDTIYCYPCTDFSDPLQPTVYLWFIGKNNLVKTLEYLANAELEEGVTVSLDYTRDKNRIQKAGDLFLKKFIVWNKGEYLPRCSTITKKFVKQDLKRLGVKPQKQKSLGDDGYFE